MLVFFLVLTAGCGDLSKQELGKEKLIKVRKQHDTRVFILCKDRRGKYYEKSLHISDQVNCGGKTLKLEDVVNICKADCYIAFPGQEKELENYIKNRKEIDMASSQK